MSLDLSMLCLSTRSTVRKEASVKAKNQPVWYMGRIPHTHCQDEKGSVEPGPVDAVHFRIVFIFHRKKEWEETKRREERDKIT